MIWYDCGEGWAPVSWARKDLGLDAILCCPGPSLKSINLDILKGPNRKVFAINTAYPTVKPNIWLGMDKMHCYDLNLLYEPFPKLFRGSYSEMTSEGNKVKYYPETYFVDVDYVPSGKTMLDLRDANTKFAWHNHTLGVALHLIIWMGAKNIYLLGCDMGGQKDYCHELILNKDQRIRNRKLYFQQTLFIQKLSEAASKQGIIIWSSTLDSPLNYSLPYKPIQEITNYVPKESKIKYVTDEV
jgi:hypothetical protein